LEAFVAAWNCSDCPGNRTAEPGLISIAELPATEVEQPLSAENEMTVKGI